MRRTIIAVILILGLLLVSSPVSAASGVQVISKSGDGVWIGNAWQVEIFPSEAQSTTITLYNSSTRSLEVEVSIQPDSLDNGNLTFELDRATFAMPGKSTSAVTLTVKASGSVTPGTYSTELEIKSEIPPPSEEPGPPTYYHTATNLFGTEESYRISYSGKIQETIEATSEDGMLTITIPEDTIALGEDGRRLKSLEVAVDETPPEPPEDAHVIGLAYDFSPDGATFDPPITLEYVYDPEALPEGVAGLVLAYYDEETGEWVELPCTVDPVTHTITASVAHFTTFAIIGKVTPPAPAAFTISSLAVSPTEVAPGEGVTISLSLANIGGMEGSYTVVLNINGLKEAEQSVTIAAGSSETVTFFVISEEAGSYSISVNGLSGSFTVVAPVIMVPPVPALFGVLNLSIQPEEVEPGEEVTISVSVSNIGGTEGSYSVVLNINGVKEAEKSVTVAPGDSEAVTFTITREEAGSYTISVDGLSGAFEVKAPPEEEVAPPAKPTNWPLIGGIIAAVIIVGLLIFFLVIRRRAY